MMRKLAVFCLLISCFAQDVSAQARQSPGKNPQKKGTRKPSRQIPVNNPITVPVDTSTTHMPELVIIAPPVDTAKRDTSAIAQVAQAVHDSVKAQIKAPIVQVPVTLKSLIIPGALFAYGALTLNTGGLRILNEEAHEAIWRGETFQHPYVEDYALLVPAAAVYAMNIFGVKGQNNLIDRSVIYGMSNAIANGIIFGVKQFGVETRPDTSDTHSFPSGHTAEAFVSAEFLHQEYKGRVHWTVIAAGYAVGVGVGYMRMYHNKHWLSDVVAGAGVGIASTRFSYYLYPIIKHVLFGSKKVKENAMIVPVYRSGGGYGLALTYGF